MLPARRSLKQKGDEREGGGGRDGSPDSLTFSLYNVSYERAACIHIRILAYFTGHFYAAPEDECNVINLRVNLKGK